MLNHARLHRVIKKLAIQVTTTPHKGFSSQEEALDYYLENQLSQIFREYVEEAKETCKVVGSGSLKERVLFYIENDIKKKIS